MLVFAFCHFRYGNSLGINQRMVNYVLVSNTSLVKYPDHRTNYRALLIHLEIATWQNTSFTGYFFPNIAIVQEAFGKLLFVLPFLSQDRLFQPQSLCNGQTPTWSLGLLSQSEYFFLLTRLSPLDFGLHTILVSKHRHPGYVSNNGSLKRFLYVFSNQFFYAAGKNISLLYVRRLINEDCETIVTLQ